MATYATPELLERFVDMVRRLGPQPRLIQFFSAISSVEGKAVKANQEMILRMVWVAITFKNKEEAEEEEEEEEERVVAP